MNFYKGLNLYVHKYELKEIGLKCNIEGYLLEKPKRNI